MRSNASLKIFIQGWNASKDKVAKPKSRGATSRGFYWRKPEQLIRRNIMTAETYLKRKNWIDIVGVNGVFMFWLGMVFSALSILRSLKLNP